MNFYGGTSSKDTWAADAATGAAHSGTAKGTQHGHLDLPVLLQGNTGEDLW